MFTYNSKNLHNGGGLDQIPVSVHIILASPSKWWEPSQLNWTKLPTAYLPPSIPGDSDWTKCPFVGKTGAKHCIAEMRYYLGVSIENYLLTIHYLRIHLGSDPDQLPLNSHSNPGGPSSL